MLINGIKFACNTCVKGHRSSNCNHIERPLFEIRKKGRPVTQCTFCRDLRKTRQIHIKCTCTDKSTKATSGGLENKAANTLPQEPCHHCPPKSNSVISEDYGIAYTDLIQNALYNNNQKESIISSSLHCTCHETATKIVYNGASNTVMNNNSGTPQQDWSQGSSEGITIRPSRGMIIEETNLKHSSTSLRFLGGQTKSPRRKTSVSRKASLNNGNSSSNGNSGITRKISNASMHSNGSNSNSSLHLQQQAQPDSDTMMIDIQPFFLNNTTTETRTESIVMQVANNNIPFSSSVSSSSNPTPDYDMLLSNATNSTDPEELTNLLNNVLMNNHHKESKRSSTEMARTDTTTSATSSSSMVPPFKQQNNMCGSLTPHNNCSLIDANQLPQQGGVGESVVITITPLSTLLGSSEDEQYKSNEAMMKQQINRIVTCYCGNSCICPGCFVHPNNTNNGNNEYFTSQQQHQQQQQQHQPQQHQQNQNHQHQQQQQQPCIQNYNIQHTLHQQAPSITNSASSNYSSDDEDHYNFNYIAITHNNSNAFV